MDCGIVNPTHDRPAGGIRPWLRLFAGIVGGAVGIAVALGAIVLLTATAAQAQASTAVPASSQSPQPASSRSSQSQSPEAAATLERLQGHRGSGLLLMTTAGPVVAPLQSTETRLRVTGPVVRAVVTQRFVNPGTQWLEGRYLFPLPDDAAVDHLRMKIGDRIVEGEIREKEAARRAFAQARSAGQRATLVEQQRPNAFTTEVTNIAPGAAIEIAIEFQQTLALKDGAWRLRLPGVVAPRYRSPIDPEAALIEEQTRRRDRREQAAAYDPDAAAADDADDEAFDCGDEPIEAGDDWQPPRLRQGWLVAAADATTAHDATRDGEPARGGVDRQPGTLDQPVLLPGQPAVNPLSIRVELDAGVPIGMPRSPTHAVRVDTTDAPGGSRYRIATRDGEPADRDFELEWSPAANALPQATLRVESFGGEYYGLLAINPPAIGSAAGQRQPRETTFVVDTSGSMGGESIDQARSALLFGLERLAPGDWFNVIQFNSTHSSVFERPQPVTPQTLARARRYVAGLKADGGTEMGGAIRQALSAPLPPDLIGQVVFITDGAVDAEDELVSLIRQRIGARRLFTVGIGSAPNGFFMRKAAEIGGGTFTYIGRTSEVELRMARLFDKLAQPLSTDLAVRFDGGVLAEPLDLPRDLYAGEPLVVFARFTELPRAVEVSATAATPGVPGPMRSEAAAAARRSAEGHSAEGHSAEGHSAKGRDDDGTAGRRWRIPVAIAPAADSGLHVQWARARIDRLGDALRQARFTAQPQDATRDAILQLALRHHLVSDFTSLVAVDRTPVRPADAPLAHGDVPANLPAGWDHAKVFGQATPTRQTSAGGAAMLAQTATPAALQLAIGLVLLAAGFLLLLSRRWSGVLGAGRLGIGRAEGRR